jgi:hypothetical protein
MLWPPPKPQKNCEITQDLASAAFGINQDAISLVIANQGLPGTNFLTRLTSQMILYSNLCKMWYFILL